MRLGEYLVKYDVLKKEELERALVIQDRRESFKPIGEILVDMELITIDTLIKFLEIQLKEKFKGYDE